MLGIMESIPELRLICQSTRPAIFRDFLSGWYYRLAIYFTWICLRLGMSANQVTLLSGAVACVGGTLIASDNPASVVVGVLCFHVFAILDMSDGEVARYRGQGGLAGHFLDWIMHFVSSSALMLGLLFSSLSRLDGLLMLVGVLAVLIPLLDKCITASTWTVIAWTRLRDMQKGEEGVCGTAEVNVCEPARGSRWWRRFLFFALAPMQDHWIPMGLLLLAVSALVSSWGGFSLPDYRFYLLLYIGIIGVPYLVLRVRRIVITPVLSEGYRRLFCLDRPVRLPQDDFLG